MKRISLLRPSLQTRLALVFLGTTTLLMVGTLGIFYAQASHVFREQLREQLRALAGTAALMVDADEHLRARGENDPTYQRFQLLFRKITEANPGVGTMYTMKLDDKGTWRFIVDSAPAGDPEHAPFNEPYTGTGTATMERALARPAADRQFSTDVYGTWLSGFAPIKDQDGKTAAILGVDISAANILQEERHLLLLALATLIAGLAFALGISIWLARVFTKPISQLAEGTRKISEGDLTTRVPASRTDELGDLARSFNAMTEAIARHRDELKENERMIQELATARKIQQAMLPAEAPTDASLNIDFYLETSTEVGGDYFDFLPVGDNKLALVIGDVTGHGVPAALLMAVIKSCLHTQVLTNHAVSNVMSIANNILHQSSFERRFMTFFYSLLDSETGRLTYANAGHPYPFLYRSARRTVEMLEMASYPLGVRPTLRVKEQEVTLEPGDMLVFYSDGIIEAQNGQGQEFGFERMEKLILDHGHLSAEGLKAKLLKTWQQHVYEGTRPLDYQAIKSDRADDDITIVVVKYAPARKVLEV
ncbi:SpoIIE family protein phosphatase [bacterium]|nr:SpoIIE family protein phosphatase [bacterium]